MCDIRQKRTILFLDKDRLGCRINDKHRFVILSSPCDNSSIPQNCETGSCCRSYIFDISKIWSTRSTILVITRSFTTMYWHRIRNHWIRITLSTPCLSILSPCIHNSITCKRKIKRTRSRSDHIKGQIARFNFLGRINNFVIIPTHRRVDAQQWTLSLRREVISPRIQITFRTNNQTVVVTT